MSTLQLKRRISKCVGVFNENTDYAFKNNAYVNLCANLLLCYLITLLPAHSSIKARFKLRAFVCRTQFILSSTLARLKLDG